VANDPQTETLHILWVRGRADGTDEVLATEAHTSRLPGAAQAFISSARCDGL